MSRGQRPRLSQSERRATIERAAIEVFAARGYRGASMDEIARRAGISAPILYDHFASKLDLYRRLMEQTRNELLELWRQHLFSDSPAPGRITRALAGWAGYVESHREETRMYFREATGDPEAEAAHRAIQDQARVALGMVLAREPGAEAYVGSGRQEEIEMAGEILRAALTGLALWWYEHQEIPRERIVETIRSVLWQGFAGAQP